MPEPDLAAYEAAERLVREAHAKAAAAARAAAASAPPNGWATPGEAPASSPDLTALLAFVEAAKGSLPPELLRQLSDALRELLIALRAVIDYSIERLERTPAPARDVEDIPIS